MPPQFDLDYLFSKQLMAKNRFQFRMYTYNNDSATRMVAEVSVAIVSLQVICGWIFFKRDGGIYEACN
jgi:hypothetical protein